MKKALLILVMILYLFSCSKAEININSNRLDGDWFMQSYTVFGPSNSNLSEDYIVWSFNTQSNMLKVVNYLYETEPYGLASGEYPFSYTEYEIFISVNNTTLRYDYEFDNDNLVLSDHPELDGPVINFISSGQNCVINPLEYLPRLHEIYTGMFEINGISSSQIIQYTYNDECVYLVNNCFNCGDNLVQVYNVSGEVICEFGGLDNLNTCPNFYEIATDKRYLYNNVTQSCNQSTTISEEMYTNVIYHPTLIGLEINNHCLHINFSDSGCDGNTWELNLIDSEEVANTEPPQRYLVLSIANEELCTTVITKELSFNIENLQVEDNNQVLLNIGDNQILYEY